MSTVHVIAAAGCIQYTKGAPDVLIGKCAYYIDSDGRRVPMTDEYRAEILRANKAMADRALRVLAVPSASGMQSPSTSSR